MSLTNDQITAQNFKDFYEQLRPYLNGTPPTYANMFNRSDLYSTEERIVGSWIDGKPLYQKTWKMDIPSTSGNYNLVDVTALNVGYPVSLEYYAVRKSDNSPINAASLSKAGFVMDYSGVQNALRVNESGSYVKSGYEIIITFRYTKTGDTAIKVGTGNDYSTDEQIIGTWIDGKPLYQKTIDTTTNSNVSDKEIDDLTGKTLVNISGIIYGSNIYMINAWDASNKMLVYEDANNKLIAYAQSAWCQGKRLIVTIQYTKTTD